MLPKVGILTSVKPWRAYTTAALLLVAAAGCGFADDNYEKAQAELDRSSPNLTVKQPVTTAAPFDTLPKVPVSEIPLRPATPGDGQVAPTGALGDNPTGSTREAGASPEVATGPGSGPYGGGFGVPTTIPLSPLCQAASSLDDLGRVMVAATDVSPSEFKAVALKTTGAFRRVVELLPADQRVAGNSLQASLSQFEAFTARPASTGEMRTYWRQLIQLEGPAITSVLKDVSYLCPQLPGIAGGANQVGAVVIG